MKRPGWILIIAAALALGAPPGAGAAGDWVALVVGNGDYKNTPALRNPVNDARALSRALDKLGFEVISGKDLTKTRMEEKIEAFGERLEDAEIAVFFYAGHGLQVDGKNYLIPVDFEVESGADLSRQLVSLNRILAVMSSDCVNLVFLDACRDNPLADDLKTQISSGRSLSLNGTRGVKVVGQGLAEVETGVGTLISFATQPGNVALDGEGDHSPFTEGLLEHMGKPGTEVSDMLKRVRKHVYEATGGRQVPWDHSSLVERYYFKKKKQGGAPLPDPRPGRGGSGHEFGSPPRRDQNEEGDHAVTFSIPGIEIQELLGAGGMGQVFRGYQSELKRMVAVKLLPHSLAADPDKIARFKQEARTLAALEHPNVLSVIDLVEQNQAHYLVMAFVDGWDLSQVLKRQGAVPPEIVLCILDDVASGLEAAHRKGIVHRDIKPGNVMINREGVVKVADFGLARDDDDLAALSMEVSNPNQIMGTVPYMSPEQHRGKRDEIDARTDIFALGVTAYEMLAGIRPFRGSFEEVRRQIFEAEPDPLRERCPRATPALEALVGTMLAKSPEDRQASMKTLREEIHACLAGLDPSGRLLAQKPDLLARFAADLGAPDRGLPMRLRAHLERGRELLEEPDDAVLRSDAETEFRYVRVLDPENTEAGAALRDLGVDPGPAGSEAAAFAPARTSRSKRFPWALTGMTMAVTVFLIWQLVSLPGSGGGGDDAVGAGTDPLTSSQAGTGLPSEVSPDREAGTPSSGAGDPGGEVGKDADGPGGPAGDVPSGGAGEKLPRSAGVVPAGLPAGERTGAEAGDVPGALDLEQAAAALAADLGRDLNPDRTQVLRVAPDNFRFRDLGASSPFLFHFQNLLLSELGKFNGIELVDRNRMRQEVKTRGIRITKRLNPNTPAAVQELGRAQAVLTGFCELEGDEVRVSSRIQDAVSDSPLAEGTVLVRRESIPQGLGVLPANLRVAQEAQKALHAPAGSSSGLHLNLWVDRLDGAVYREGEDVTVFVWVNLDCYLYLVYVFADGTYRVILPNEFATENRLTGGRVYTVPDDIPSPTPIAFTVVEPFGVETIKAFASTQPLPEFEGSYGTGGYLAVDLTLEEFAERTRGIAVRPKSVDPDLLRAEASCVITTIAAGD